ncbi:MAG: hypothetical protein M3414_05420, partial [Pseudomonadota bacterium]|nr:hypothetical protein [Pseudomonadota bacterium]
MASKWLHWLYRESFDVAELTAQGAADLLLVATATNVADSLLPTFVSASLSDDPDRIVIRKINPERLLRTTGDHNSYSMPLQG